MGFGTSIMKMLMFVFNGIVWVLGLVLFVVGIVVLVEGKNWSDIIDGKTVPVSVLLIVVGLAIAVVGFLGCCGAMKQNGTMLIAYTILLGVIIMLQLVAGVLAFIFSDQTDEIVKKNLEGFMKAYTGNPDSNTDHVLNVIMEEFDCCGFYNADDFKTMTDPAKWTQTNVPDSCCVKMESQCGWDYEGKSDTTIYFEGCYAKTVDSIRGNMKLVGLCAIIFCILEFVQIIIACALKKHGKGVLA